MSARKLAALAAVLLLACLPAVAQLAGKLYARPQAELLFPFDTYVNATSQASEALYSTVSFGIGSTLDFAVLPWLLPFVRGQYVDAPYASGGSALQAAEGDLGVGAIWRPTDRLSLRLDAMGGLAQLFAPSKSGPAYAAGARLGLGYRFAPAITLGLSGGYSTYFGTQAPIFSAFEAGLSLSYDLSAVAGPKPRLSVEDVKLDAVFPSLYAYYDDNAFGSVRIVNREDAAIRDVKVSFNAGRYMDQPKVCGQYASIPQGASMTVPVKALFSDSVLNITQGTDAKAEVIVEYSYLGVDRTVRAPIDFRMHHRNAITWSDDRRAAAFVSPTNPAALWFSKYAAGIVRDRLRGDINKPLQYAIGMFESERLYGLNYVVVPANDYSVKHGLKDYIDSVQFPHQTLANRGGDCSDLAILFATLMQSVGVEAAFITIPGHIFAAFDTSLTEAAAKESFYDPGLLVFQGGKAWIPVEVTMVKDGFIKAWRVAAKEWADNSRAGAAAFYRLPECWKVYPSAAFPDVNPRFTLPDDTDTALAFDGALDRFVAREIEPKVQSLEAAVAKSDPKLRANELGILFANYGMLKESWKYLSESAKAGQQEAWTNLGNVAYLRKDFNLALSYFQYALSLNESDDYALLGLARCQYELEDFKSSDAAYAQLKSRNPELAGKFGYLASIFGGEGRAWSLADRFASTKWSSLMTAKAAVAAPAPTPAPKAIAAVPAIPLAPEPAVAVAPTVETPPEAPAGPPVIAAELPVDTELALRSADAAMQRASVDEEAKAAQAQAAEARRAALAKPAVQAPVAIEPAAPIAPVAVTAPIAPPPIAVELPTDKELAQKSADNAAQKAVAAAQVKPAEALVPAAPKPAAAKAAPAAIAPPPISAELPTDKELAQRSADIAAQKAAAAPKVKPIAAPVPPPLQPAVEEPAPAQVAPPAAAPAVADTKPVEAPASVQEPAAPAQAPPAPATEPVHVTAPIETPEPAPVEAASIAEASPPIVVVKVPEIASVGDSDLPFALGKELLLEGFAAARPIVGTWSIKDGVARQTDHEAFYAKLATPLVQDQRSFSYFFSARSNARGRGWVGLGLHVFTPKSYTLKGYGSGDSLCVWLTRDPVHFKKDITRLQLYRSVNDWDMKLLDEVPVAESIYDLNRFEVGVDPAAGTVSVSLNGSERLVAKGIKNLRGGVYVMLRALDTAEFTDFRAEVAK